MARCHPKNKTTTPLDLLHHQRVLPWLGNMPRCMHQRVRTVRTMHSHHRSCTKPQLVDWMVPFLLPHWFHLHLNWMDLGCMVGLPHLPKGQVILIRIYQIYVSKLSFPFSKIFLYSNFEDTFSRTF